MPIGEPNISSPEYSGRVYLTDTDVFTRMEVIFNFSYMQEPDSVGTPDDIVQSLIDHLAAWPHTASVAADRSTLNYAQVTPTDG